METNKKIKRSGRERGNALFLILIAVALFAALSYAITQSGRGGGNVSSQTNLITAGQVTELPADVRSAVARMMVTGVSAASITYSGTASANDVFDQVTGGGGATSVPPPTAACVSPADCTANSPPTYNGWTYVQATAGNGNFVNGVGSAGANGGDAFAVLQGTSGVTEAVCAAIQKGLGFTTTVPPTQAVAKVLWGTASTYAAAGNAATVSNGVGGTLQGQDFACINNFTAGLYAYYGVLIDQ